MALRERAARVSASTRRSDARRLYPAAREPLRDAAPDWRSAPGDVGWATLRLPTPGPMLRNTFTPPCGFDLATTTVAGADGLAAVAYWGYRLVLHPDGSCFLHETYYDAREGLLGIAREPARPCGDTAGDVRDALALMGEGLAEPALRWLDYVVTPEGTSGDGAAGPPPR